MSNVSAAGFYDRYWAYRVERGDHLATNRIKLRHQQTAQFLREQFPKTGGDPIRVLDLGCGDGLLGQVLRQEGYHLTGCDVARRALELCSPYYQQTHLFNMDTDSTPQDWREAFDAVTCLEVLEHIETPKENIRRVFELCRPGGAAVFSFPNMFTWKNRLLFLTGRGPRGYTTYDAREHLQVFELRQIKRWVGQAGFDLCGIAITPDLPTFKPLRRLMFNMRAALNHLGPTLWAMQITVFATRPTNG